MHHVRAAFRGASVVAFWLATALAVSAQTTPAQVPPKEDKITLDTFVVSSTEWSALQNATESRRQSIRLTDSVVSNDLGVLPDFNVGENLARLPGISIDLDQAEARYVTVRGFNPNYTATTINGSVIAATERNTRRVEMDVLPASLASTIEVIKSQTPDMEGHSVGGAINIKGPLAIQGRPFTATLNAKVGTYTNETGYAPKHPSSAADFLVNRTFLDGKMGITVSGNYYLRDSYTPQTEFGSSRYWFDTTGKRVATPYGGNGYEVPVERRWYWYLNHRERKGGSVSWEYNPSANLRLWALGYYNTATDHESRQTDLLSWPTSTTVSNQTATSGTLTSPSMLQQIYLGEFNFERDVGGIQTGADLRSGDKLLSARLNYSGSFFKNPETFNEWRQTGSQLAVNYQQVGDLFQFQDINPTAHHNYAAYTPFKREFNSRALREDVTEGSLDFSDKSLAGIEGLSYKVGGKQRHIHRRYHESRLDYFANAGAVYPLASVVRTDLNLQPIGGVGDQHIVIIDPALSRNSWDATYAANPTQYTIQRPDTTNNQLNYTANEGVTAGYAMLEFKRGRWSGIGGVRYENTREDTTGRAVKNGVWGDSHSGGNYGETLPSLVVNFDITSKDRALFSVSKTIGRPAFNQFAPVGDSISDSSSALTITRANPALKAREATNYNLSLDHYFEKGAGFVSASVFQVDVKGEIYTTTSQMDIVYEGATRTATVTQPTNSTRATRMQGLEFIVMRRLDFLPGPFGDFKINGNLTLLDSNFAMLMTDGTWYQPKGPIGMPRKAWNMAVLYDKSRFSAKLAWNYTGLKLNNSTNTTDAYRNRYDSASLRLSANASYRFSKQWTMTISGWNLTGVGRKEVMGLNQEIPIVTADFGRAYFMGFTYSIR